MMSIRIAEPKDAIHIALLGRITFDQSFGHLFEDKQELSAYLDKTFSVAKIEASLQKTNNIFWLAIYNELPIGYAKLKLASPTQFTSAQSISQLQKIYVLSEFTAKKVGKLLLQVLLSKAKEAGSTDIWLSVWKANQKAIRFYQKNEFQEVGGHLFQIGKQNFDFIVMSKSLV